jgi:hypothetical protein
MGELPYARVDLELTRAFEAVARRLVAKKTTR